MRRLEIFNLARTMSLFKLNEMSVYGVIRLNCSSKRLSMIIVCSTQFVILNKCHTGNNCFNWDFIIFKYFLNHLLRNFVHRKYTRCHWNYDWLSGYKRVNLSFNRLIWHSVSTNLKKNEFYFFFPLDLWFWY